MRGLFEEMKEWDWFGIFVFAEFFFLFGMALLTYIKHG